MTPRARKPKRSTSSIAMSKTKPTELLGHEVGQFWDEAHPIPISAAQHIAETYGYEQVVIIARHIGADGVEHCTTYGVDKANCDVAARIGDFLKFKVMNWKREDQPYLDYQRESEEP